MTKQAPAKDTNRYFEEIKVDEIYEVSDARTITSADIVSFAGLSGDFHPHHLSEPFARNESNFDERVAHGNLVFVLTEGIVSEINRKALSYGHDNIRYVNPVTIGDTISARRKVLEKEDYNDEMGRILYEYEATNQHGDTVMIDNHIMLVRKRDANNTP